MIDAKEYRVPDFIPLRSNLVAIISKRINVPPTLKWIKYDQIKKNYHEKEVLIWCPENYTNI